MSYKEDLRWLPALARLVEPFHSDGGEAVGTAGLNNARIIAENAWRVASFR